MRDFETHPRGTGEVLAQLRAEREDLTIQVAEQRRLLEQAGFLCDWLMETPHQRGSVNGAAAQLLHAITQQLKGNP